MPNAVLTIDLSAEFVDKLAEAIIARLEGKPAAVQPPAATDGVPAAPAVPAAADPWDSTPWPESPAEPEVPAAPAPPTPPAQQPAQSSRPASGTVTDAKGRTWTFGAPNSPACQCSPPQPAVCVQGSTNGKPWSQWRCAKDFDDYKNKCQYSAFAGGKK